MAQRGGSQWVVGVAIVVAVVVAVFVFKPDLVQDLLYRIQAPRQERALRQRATEFINALYEKNFDKCVDYTDPGVVRQQGANGLKFAYGLVAAIAQLAKITPADIEIVSISINRDLSHAEVKHRLRINGEWKDQQPGKWVRVAGLWYVSR